MSTTDNLAAIQARADAALPDEARMDAYYYWFDRTGIGCVDAILSAVAIAGKGAHHTESWNEESDGGYYSKRPGLPDATSAIDLIQKAAEVAAANFADVSTLLSIVREQAAQITAVLDLANVSGRRGWRINADDIRKTLGAE